MLPPPPQAHPLFKKPIAGGPVHSHHEQEEQMHRDFDRRAYETLEELAAYERLTADMIAQAGASLRSGA